MWSVCTECAYYLGNGHCKMTSARINERLASLRLKCATYEPMPVLEEKNPKRDKETKEGSKCRAMYSGAVQLRFEGILT